jgi:hypothetical protein
MIPFHGPEEDAGQPIIICLYREESLIRQLKFAIRPMAY